MPSSPAASEASEVFWSPAESFTEQVPSLSGLLSADEKADEAVPALSQLLMQDAAQELDETANGGGSSSGGVDDEVTMDMTRAVGGILPIH